MGIQERPWVVSPRSGYLRHRLYNNIAQLLQTFFRALEQMQSDDRLCSIFQSFDFRHRQCQMQLSESVVRTGNDQSSRARW